MGDFPLELVTATIWIYWFCVGVMIVRVRRKAHHSVGLVPEQRVERYMWLVWVPLVALWAALPYLALSRTSGPLSLPDFARGQPLYAALRWVAAIAGAICLGATIKCWARMGEDWRMDVSVERKTELITDGLFRYIRHPIYAFSVLLMLCTAVVAPTIPMLVVAAVHVVLMNMKARNEERYLLQSHGEAYARYVTQTGRFFPRPGGTRP
jgi:protein-S-isoprenylcysteine O-methyltransferase Ste14